MKRPALCLAAALAAALPACTPPPPTPQGRAAEAAVVACRTRADEVYLRQNRATLYDNDRRDAPESAAYISGITSRGLAERYGWDRQVSDCVRSQGGGGDEGANAGVGPTMAPAAGTTMPTTGTGAR